MNRLRKWLVVGACCAGLAQFWLTPNTQKGNQSKYKYQGSSGAQYQYDLADPGDRLLYKANPEAKLRDKASIDLGRKADRSLGQKGGGIKW